MGDENWDDDDVRMRLLSTYSFCIALEIFLAVCSLNISLMWATSGTSWMHFI